MRVLNPGPGELVDRLTVVARKIVEGGERAEHFKEEMAELIGHWSSRSFSDGPEDARYATAAYMLAAVNAAIWQREDEVRKYRTSIPNEDTENIANLAYRIQELNDQRAKLVQEINAAAGINREEKL